MDSKSMKGMGPAVPHLADKPGGLAGEIWDLRGDVDRACSRLETPGAGGTGVVAVEEWSAPPAASIDYFLPATVLGMTRHVETSAAAPLAVPRNVMIDFIVTVGTPSGSLVVTGRDVAGVVRSATVPMPAASALVDAGIALVDVDTIEFLPLPPTLFDGTASVGYGDAIGLGSPAKTRQMGVHVIDEYMDGAIVSPITATFTDKTLAQPNGTYLPATVPDGTHTYLLTYERDNA